MTCCNRSGSCAQTFTERAARNDLARFRKDGLDRIERQMIDSAISAGLGDGRVLEIGGGIGKLQAELLTAGAVSGEVVELVSAYEPYALELARELELEDRTTYVVADILDQPESVDPADLVLMNRVVCCSADGVELTAAAARLTRRTLVLSYPRDVWWVRLGIRAINAAQRVIRRSFRAFVHPPSALLAAAQAEGLTLVASGRSRIWEFAALGRG
jgi:magnesium-protoporphyrin O-methyltransferase